MNGLAFRGTNFFFSKIMEYSEKECKRYDLTFEELQRARDKWKKDRMKQLDIITKRLHQGNEARVYINKCWWSNGWKLSNKKQIKRLTHEPQLSNFYNPSVGEKNSELLQWLQAYSL